MQDNNQFRFTPSTWIIPTFILFLIWIIFYLDTSNQLHLNSHGIFPRTLLGLQGIFFSPFLHGDSHHIANNSWSLFVLTTALLYFYREVSLKVLFYGVIASGFITWVIARPSYHIGASGLIYVLVSFIFFKGLMTKYYRLMALSFTIVLVYGGMIWYVFPEIDNTISWEGHMAGLITGFVFAIKFKTPDYNQYLRYDWQQPDFNPENDKFMQRFDENGNFVNLPIQETPEDNNDILPTYVYEFKEKNV
jgi:membrane associated rhomboid family serine protease